MALFVEKISTMPFPSVPAQRIASVPGLQAVTRNCCKRLTWSAKKIRWTECCVIYAHATESPGKRDNVADREVMAAIPAGKSGNRQRFAAPGIELAQQVQRIGKEEERLPRCKEIIDSSYILDSLLMHECCSFFYIHFQCPCIVKDAKAVMVIESDLLHTRRVAGNRIHQKAVCLLLHRSG